MSDRTYLDRRREMPQLVTVLTRWGCWVVGSRALLEHAGNDWDVVVPLEEWALIAPILDQYGAVSATRFGGVRVTTESGPIDVWPDSLARLLQEPWVKAAWHPKSGRVIHVRNEAPDRWRDEEAQ